MTSESDSARTRRDNDYPSSPGSAPFIGSSRFPDRPAPTRASTLGSTHDLGRPNLAAKHDHGAHARSDDLNHSHSNRYDMNGMPGSLPHSSPAFLSSGSPPLSNHATRSPPSECAPERPRRRSVASQSSAHSNSSSSSGPNKGGGPLTSTSSATSANLSSS